MDEDMSALVATLLRARGLDVATTSDKANFGKSDNQQLILASSMGRCIVTHNRVDFERLHIDNLKANQQHSGIIVVPQKNAYEVARRIGILVTTLMADEIYNQLFYV
jgi:galactitol-specific phosphotransferase system IIB component